MDGSETISLESVPARWLVEHPRNLLIGDGPYALALGQVLGATCVGLDDLLFGPTMHDEGGFPQLLGSLEGVILVAGVGDTAADLLRWHEVVWQWIEKLSPEGDQHDVAILFVLADASGSSIADGLALGLGLEKIDPATNGHGFARMGDTLETLCTTLAAIHPMDLPPLRARKAANQRYQALEELKHAASLNEPTALHAAVEWVRSAFEGCEYHLDLFCRPPNHRNGNQLRTWLNGIVTGSVTPYDKAAESPLDWLCDTKFL